MDFSFFLFPFPVSPYFPISSSASVHLRVTPSPFQNFTCGAFAAPASALKGSFSVKWSKRLLVKLFGNTRMEVLKISTALL